MPARAPKIAIVADWLTNMGGAERVILAMHEAFPDAPIFTSTYTPETMPAFDGLDIRTTYLQRLPKPLRKLHKLFPMLRVRAFQSLDLSDYDIIVSSSSAEAKQVRKTRPDQVHICYCHTPIRYYWSHYKEYKKDPGMGALNPLVRLAMPFFVPPLRKADYDAAQNVDVFIANSDEVQRRITQYYGRTSTVIHPPVDVKRFTPAKKRGDFYITIGRQVPYKRFDLVITAATELGIPLHVFGKGSEHARLKSLAGPNVHFHTDRYGDASDQAVTEAFNTAKGFIYPAEEDFGIVQAEALAGGTPVITLKKGGALDIVDETVSGVFFDEQTPEAIKKAIQKADTLKFSPGILHQKAKRFDKSLFITKIRKIVYDHRPSNTP